MEHSESRPSAGTIVNIQNGIGPYCRITLFNDWIILLGTDESSGLPDFSACLKIFYNRKLFLFLFEDQF